MLSAITTEDITDVMQTLLGMARAGDLSAIKLLLDHTAGKPTTPQQTPTIAAQPTVQLSQPGDGRRLAQAVVERIQRERRSNGIS